MKDLVGQLVKLRAGCLPAHTGAGGDPPHNRYLQIAAARLLAFDGFEQRLEVTLAEPLRAVPLDQLEEDRRPVLHRLGEDLPPMLLL